MASSTTKTSSSSKRTSKRAAKPATTAAATTTAKAAATTTTAALAVNRQRIPFTIDPYGQNGVALEETLALRQADAQSRVYVGIEQLHASLQDLTQALASSTLPPHVHVVLLQPDGTAASYVQVQLNPKDVKSSGKAIHVVTRHDGFFVMKLPRDGTMPKGGLPLTIHGGEGAAEQLTIPAEQIAANGAVGIVRLKKPMRGLPVSILQSLVDLADGVEKTTEPAKPTPLQPLPSVTIGEEGSVCKQTFLTNWSVDRFPWKIFFRLVEPHMSIVTRARRSTERGEFHPIADVATGAAGGEAGKAVYLDRVPVDQPLSVDGFKARIAGLDVTGSRFVADETVPTAATLGLGYTLNFVQKWTFEGLALGNLVYSLPLAPGEQQQVAVFERTDTSSVFESESFSEEEAMAQQALADTSALATFTAAFAEALAGGSNFYTTSENNSQAGSFLGFFSAGGASSTSQGNSGEWLQGQRDSSQDAVELTHSAASNQASARREAARTGMRLAQASESESVTTRTITNHNHTRALTMQYWEVLRMYDVTTEIDSVSLCCLVPLQVVRFMPPGEPVSIANAALVDTRAKVLARYHNILAHLDVLRRTIPRRYRHGLELLSQFAADPTAQVEPAGGVAEDVIEFKLTGSFIFCDVVTVVAVTKRNTRVGPVRLTPATQTPFPQIPDDRFVSGDEVLFWIEEQRLGANVVLQGNLALPPSMNRSEIVGFEISRQLTPVHTTLITEELRQLRYYEKEAPDIFKAAIEESLQAANRRIPCTIESIALERKIGGPFVTSLHAAIEERNAQGNTVPSSTETFASD
ncbi:MAG TPA: hypothetical protein VF407_08050, partial [Polyangiaceae bacterium]